jgi:hypothetical protein
MNLGLGLGLGFGQRTGASWSPATPSSKVAWFKADAGTNTTTDGATITSWADQFGVQASYGVGAGTTTYKASGINSNPCIATPGTSRLSSASSASWGLTSAYTLYFVGKMTSVGTFNCIASKGVSDGWDHYVSGSAITTVHQGISFPSSADAARFAVNTPFLIAIYYDGTTVTWKVNGVSLGSHAIPVPNTNAIPASVGQRSDGVTTFTGQIAEQVVYSTSLLGTADDTSMLAYLRGRWGALT